MALELYRKKRNFSKTSEPSGEASSKPSGKQPIFIIQKHAASRLHFDFRLEMDGVLKSWAVPKGPSMDSAVKRLAILVEDHPLGYASFEGTIPQGEYGGGTVMLWDQGTFAFNEKDDFESGLLEFKLFGERLHGSFALIQKKGDRKTWWLVKKTDEYAQKNSDTTLEFMTSVVSGKKMEEIE